MLLIFFMFSSLAFVVGKVYERCELAKELKEVHGAPSNQLATWVCIARHESEFRTYAVGHMGEKGSADHGIFQISDKYWCSPPGKIQACGLNCAMLEDDDITDDFKCAKKIYEEHKIMTGDGFNAWAVYQPYCKGSKAKKYIKDCFGESNKTKPFTSEKLFSAPGFFNAEEKEKKTVFYPKIVIGNLATRKTLESTTRISTTRRTTTVRPKHFSIRNNFNNHRLGVTGFSVVNPTATSYTSSTSSKFATEKYQVSHFQTSLKPFNTRKPFKPVGPKTGSFAFSNRPSYTTTTTPRYFTSSAGFKHVRTNGALKSSTTRRPLFIFNGMEWYR